MRNYYQILGVPRNATLGQIKSAYRKLASKTHPDKGGAEVSFIRINEAYEVLKDADKRAKFEREWAKRVIRKGRVKPNFRFSSLNPAYELFLEDWILSNLRQLRAMVRETVPEGNWGKVTLDISDTGQTIVSLVKIETNGSVTYQPISLSSRRKQ